MDSEARLMRALGASAAPARDPGFALAVIRAAEARRFKESAVRSVLSAGAVAAAAAGLALPLLGWAVSNYDAMQTGLLGAAGLLTLVGGARLMTQRLATAVVR